MMARPLWETQLVPILNKDSFNFFNKGLNIDLQLYIRQYVLSSLILLVFLCGVLFFSWIKTFSSALDSSCNWSLIVLICSSFQIIFIEFYQLKMNDFDSLCNLAVLNPINNTLSFWIGSYHATDNWCQLSFNTEESFEKSRSCLNASTLVWRIGL